MLATVDANGVGVVVVDVAGLEPKRDVVVVPVAGAVEVVVVFPKRGPPEKAGLDVVLPKMEVLPVFPNKPVPPPNPNPPVVPVVVA